MVGEHQKPPEGYRLLKPGETTQLGDMYWSNHDCDWRTTRQNKGKLIGEDGYAVGASLTKLYCQKIDEPEIEREHPDGEAGRRYGNKPIYRVSQPYRQSPAYRQSHSHIGRRSM